MSGTRTKTSKTKKSTESALKRQKRSSSTNKLSSSKTKTAQKSRGKSSSATPRTTESSSSFSTKKMKIAKKPSVSSQQESSASKIKDPWAGYDFDNMPPITPEQAVTFRRVTKEEHERFKRIGRPKKNPEEKFLPITIKMEPDLLEMTKKQALAHGIAWQTYLKKILREKLQEGEKIA